MQYYISRFERTQPPAEEEGREVCCPCCGVCAEIYYRNEAGEVAGCESCLKATYWYELTEEQEEFF